MNINYRYVERELRYLGEALHQPKRPFVAVLGGAKISGKIDLIEALLPKVDEILLGGAMACTFFKAMGLETCMTLGMLSGEQARALKDAGLDYYNHNIDTSPEHYGDIITTRTFQDRLDTLSEVRNAGMAVCCGGIVGMGETRADRVGFVHALATLPAHPESVGQCADPDQGHRAWRHVRR